MQKMNKNTEQNITELTIQEVLKDATPDMLELLLKRAKNEDIKSLTETQVHINLLQDYHSQLTDAVSSHGVEVRSKDGKSIDLLELAKPKGLYGLEADNELIEIELLLQDTHTGKVLAYNKEFGEMDLHSFRAIGSKEELFKFMIDKQRELSEEVSEMVVGR
jgi:hypothetical protein